MLLRLLRCRCCCCCSWPQASSACLFRAVYCISRFKMLLFEGLERRLGLL